LCLPQDSSGFIETRAQKISTCKMKHVFLFKIIYYYEKRKEIIILKKEKFYVILKKSKKNKKYYIIQNICIMQ
jgi:hypothetical protein